jgi:hypothetical protein
MTLVITYPVAYPRTQKDFSFFITTTLLKLTFALYCLRIFILWLHRRAIKFNLGFTPAEAVASENLVCGIIWDSRERPARTVKLVRLF